MAKPIKLPPLRNLRVQNSGKSEANNYCVTAMSSVLACWAASGHKMSGCATVEAALRSCMDQPRPSKKQAPTINYHLGRMQRRVTQAGRKTGSKS